MEKLLKRIEEQKQGRVATKNDIGEFFHQDALAGHEGASLGASGTEGYDHHNTQPKVRKVTQGPPPPNYKGFSKIEDLNSVHLKPTSSALEVRVVEDSSKNSKYRSSSSKWQASNEGDSNKSSHKGRVPSNAPPPVVRKVAAYNEEAHKRNSGLLTTDAWRHTTHSTLPERAKHATAVAIANGPSKDPHVKKHRAAAVSNQEANNQEGVSSPLTVSDQPSLRPPSKTAREILAEIQDEHKEISKQLIESKASKKRKPPKDKEAGAAVENAQHEPQEQVVSKAKNYDTDSVRQYMARKRELERLKDRKNQEEERRKREDKERRLKDLEKKRREAASKAVKRPVFHPDADKPSRGSSAHGAKPGGGAMGDVSASASQHDVDGIGGPHSLFTSTQRAQEACLVLNSSHESSDKENNKKTKHTPANLAKDLGPDPTKTATTLPAPSHSSNYQTSKPNRNFNVSDLLNSTSNTFDGDSSSQIGRTAVQHFGSSRTSEGGHAKESISTSEVHEQLRRSKALLAELNMKRMGIPTTLGTRKDPGLDDTNFSGDSTLDSKHKTGAPVNNKDVMASGDVDSVSSTQHPQLAATDFNDRLMKLSKTANDLRNRLSNETKILADKIPPRSNNPNVQFLLTELLNNSASAETNNTAARLRELTNLHQNLSSLPVNPSRQSGVASSALNRSLLDPIDETSHNDDVIPAVPSKPRYHMKKVGAHKSGDNFTANQDAPQDDFQIPPNEVGWNGTIGGQVNGTDGHANRQYRDKNSKNFGDPLKYRKPGSSKRQNVQNESVALTNGGSSAKQFKWQLPEPKLHVMQMPNNQNLTSEQAKLDSANPSNSNTRVSARTVVQHISKTGSPSTSTAVFSTNDIKQTGGKEDLDTYIKRLLQEAELHSPESVVANHAHVISNYFNGAQFPQSENLLQSRIGGGDPFSVINIYTKQKAEELAKSSGMNKEMQIEALKKGQLSLDLELMSTDDEGQEDTESHSNNEQQNVSIGSRHLEEEEQAAASIITSNLHMARESPGLSGLKDRRLSSTSSIDVSEIAEAVVQEQKHRRALSPKTSGGINPNIIADFHFGAERFSPATLEQKLLSELNFLESMSDSMHQLTDAEKIYAVANVQQETVALSQILKARQQAHESDLKELATKARQEAEEASRQLREAQQKANYAALEAGLMQKKSEAELNLLARSEQLLSSQQKAAEATANAVDQLVNLSSKARYVEGAESAEPDVTAKQQGPSSQLPQSSSTFNGPTAQQIATTAAIAAARAVVAETLKQSMSKVSPSRRDDSSSSPFQSRLRTPTGSASSTPTEMMSPRSMSKRSSIHRKSYSTDPEMRSSAQSPLSSPRGASDQATPKAAKSSHQPTRSSISEELVYSLSARKSQATPPVQDRKAVEENHNLDDSRTIYTEKYSEMLSEASSQGEKEKLIPDKSEVESDISFSDENGNASLHSIGSLQPAEGARMDPKNISASIQEETRDSLASKPPLSPKRKATSPRPQSVKSLISRSDSVHSQYSTDISSKADSPRHQKKSVPSSSKSRSAADVDASVVTADYTEDFEVTKDGYSKTTSAVEDVQKKGTSGKLSSRSAKAKDPTARRPDSPSKENSESGLWSVASAEDVEFSEEMLKQYLREEERRAQHQAALIKLREKAIKEKASAEMDYLDQLKLKNKGDAERMTTIKKRQRAVVIKLQEEQAELRRLELANKAGYQQRQLLLVQQREIAKMRNNTLQLKNKIKQLESAAIFEEGLDSVSVSGKRTGVPSSYLKSSKIKELKKELVEEERRLSSLEKNTASSSEVNIGKSGGPRKGAAEANDVRSDSSSIVEDIDNKSNVASKRGSQPNAALDSSVTTNRSLSEVDEYGSSQARLPASIISSPRSLLSNSHMGKIKLSPRTKSPILPSAQAAANALRIRRRRRLSSGADYDESFNSDIAPTSSYSDASDIEGRIQALKEDLRKRKEEAERLRQLKKGKKSRDREHARLQEESIRKQLKYYEDYIEKTTAELEKADSEVAQKAEKGDKYAKPVIKTPSAKSSVSSSSGSFLKPSDSEPEAVKSIANDVERYSEARSESVEPEKVPSVIRSKGESDYDESKTKESEFDEKVKEQDDDEKAKTIDDASIVESIDHESNSSTLEEDVSQPLSKAQTQESDATPLGSPRASTPVMSKESTPVMSKEMEVNETSESLNIDVQSIHSVPEENIRSSIHSLHDDNTSLKDSTAPISDDESLRKSDREDFHILADPDPSIIVGSKVFVDENKIGFVKFKNQVKDKYFIGIELENHSEPHDLRCDDFFKCDKGSGILTADFDRVSIFKEPIVEQPLETSVAPDTNKEEVSYVGDGDYSLDFDEKTTATATTPRVLASVHSIKEEISFEENDDVSSESSSIAVRSIHADVITEPEKSEIEKSEQSDTERSEKNESEKSELEKSEIEKSELEKSEIEKSELEKSEIEKSELEKSEIEKSERSKTESKIPEVEDSDKEDLSVSFSVHEVDTVNVAEIIETVEPTGQAGVAEPEVCSVLDEKTDNSEKKDSLEVSSEEPPVVRLDPIFSEEDADACCNQVFDSVFEEIMDEVFEDRELHIGFVNDLSEEMSKEFMEKALVDTMECRETKRLKLENKNILPPLFLDEEPAGEVDKSPSPVLDGEILDTKDEESSVSGIIPDVPEKQASPQSQIPESSPPMSPTLGLTGEFIDDDFGLSSGPVGEPSDRDGPIVPPIDISEITSAPEVGIQKPELPSSGISVEEAALSARLSVHAERIASLVEPQIFVPSKPEEMKNLSNTFSSYFFEQRNKGCDLAEVKIPLELLGSESVANDDVSRCKKYFKSMLFELVREIVMDVYATEPPVSHSWMKPKLAKKVHYHGLRPKSVEFLNEIVEKKVMNLINLSVRPQHRSQTLKFGHKRRDLVDKILIQELREEESQWVDYNNDELNVKMQLTDAIFDSLIEDTVNVLNTIQSKHSNQSVM